MSQAFFNETPLWRIPQWFHGINPSQLSLLKAYHDDLSKWTKKINLISPNTFLESDRIHFADSILGHGLILKALAGKAISDLGSGNGFPAIVFSILSSEATFECVDSDERKISFIKQFAVRHGLKNLSVRVARIESLEEPSIATATTRALGSVDRVLGLCTTKVVHGGTIYMFKGPEWEREVSEVLKCSTWNISLVGEYELPQIQSNLPEKRVILSAVRS